MINTVALMGRLTYPPQLTATKTGKSVTRFQVACDRSYQASGQERQADFIDCIAWDKTADFVHKYFHKGQMIALEGRIQTQHYTDKIGNDRKSTDVVAVNVSFCGSKSENDKPNLNVKREDTEYEVIDDDKAPWE